jgi:hypothetical protein
VTGPRPGPNAYRDALEAARANEHRLRIASLRRLDKALLDYSTRLTQELAKLPKGLDQATRRIAAQRAIELTTSMRAGLAQSMEKAVASGRQTAFSNILALQTEATQRIAAMEDIPDRLLGAVTAPNLTMAGAWESLGKGSATWRTLLRGHVDDAVADTQYIVTQGLLEGIDPSELSRRLRPYVQGAEDFQTAFKGAGEISDKLLRDPLRSGAARRLRFNADRIAFSEIHNARAEAEIQAFAADPFVKAVRWQLSPNRGKLRRRDACDGLAKTDFFGLGAGVYPVDQVPISPHPFCRCERVPIPRPYSEIHLPKPSPPRLNVKTVLGTGCAH